MAITYIFKNKKIHIFFTCLCNNDILLIKLRKMSGDLRAKKNSRFSNKTGGNKKENQKGALDLQSYGLNDGEVDLSKEFSTVTSTEEGYEDISEDRIITTKV